MTPSPPSPSPGFHPNPDPDGAALLQTARGRTVDPFRCIRRAWDLFCLNPWPIIGAVALIAIIVATATGIPGGFIINGPCLGGLYLYLLRQIRGQSVEFGDVFSGFKNRLIPLLICSTLAGLLQLAGLFLLVLPGLYLIFIWSFSFQLIIDKGLDFWPAMELSRKTVHAHFGPLLTLLLVNVGINLLGCLLCGVGLFLTMPITLLATLHAYEDLFLENPHHNPEPEPGTGASPA